MPGFGCNFPAPEAGALRPINELAAAISYRLWREGANRKELRFWPGMPPTRVARQLAMAFQAMPEHVLKHPRATDELGHAP